MEQFTCSNIKDIDRPIVVGDVLTGEGKVVDLYEKESKGRTMTFLVVEDQYRDEQGATGDFSMIVSLSDAWKPDHFRRAEDGGVTDLLTMPWSYYGGFELALPEKLNGMKRFADEIMAPLQG